MTGLNSAKKMSEKQEIIKWQLDIEPERDMKRYMSFTRKLNSFVAFYFIHWLVRSNSLKSVINCNSSPVVQQIDSRKVKKNIFGDLHMKMNEYIYVNCLFVSSRLSYVFWGKGASLGPQWACWGLIWLLDRPMLGPGGLHTHTRLKSTRLESFSLAEV